MAQTDGDIIKSFLVGLGFQVDEKSLRIFNSEIAKSATRITALYTAVNAFAGAIVFAFSKISEGFEEMGYQYHIVAPAINKAIVLRRELMKAYGAAGINIRKTIVDSIKLNMSLTKTKFAFEAIYKSVASRFFGELTRQSDAFRKRLYENMPYIINALEKLVKVTFKAFKAVTILGGRVWSILSRVYDFFVTLHKATDGWSTIVIGLAAAWRLLNLAFIATPLGALLTGFVALLALFDDFKTWQEGGKSLFDWSSFVPVINAVTSALLGMKKVLDGVFTVIFEVGGAIYEYFSGNSFAAIEHLKNAFQGLGTIVNGVWDTIKGLASSIGALGTWGGGLYEKFFGNGQTPQAFNPQQTAPLGSTPPPGRQTTNANMQTSINITGSPNADATARLTAQQQQNVNRDFVRNLKGATR
ncbi:MAG: hypothetical protein OEW15_11670 [Nitrospirota bacterium]|nr:hypothetical protein [Nitrospirota bacterium]